MKQTNYYRDRRKSMMRIIAIVLCIALVAGVVAVGVIFTTSGSYAEPLDDQIVNTSGPGFADTPPITTPDDASEPDEAVDDTEEPEEPKAPVSIVITEYPRNMIVGDSASIGYRVENADARANILWDSSDNGIVDVDSRGAVRALAPGKAEITVSIEDAKASILISVSENVIVPKSFKVEVEEFTIEDMLLRTHDLKEGDELHMNVQVDPVDAQLNGNFEWDTNRSGVVTIRTQGDHNENAVLRADKSGEVTVTVRYVDENEVESERVSLDDSEISLNVTEEESSVNFLMIVIIIAVIVAIIIALIATARGRRRRREEAERRERIARKQRENSRREKTRQAERESLMDEGYERGYRDSEADQFERITRVYDIPPLQGEAEQGRPIDPAETENAPMNEGEPDRPFSVDDIE
jgi:flagellar basal body-associated protein FliL